MEDHEGLGNVKLHVLQFGQKDPDSKESLEIRLSRTPMIDYVPPPLSDLMYLTRIHIVQSF